MHHITGGIRVSFGKIKLFEGVLERENVLLLLGLRLAAVAPVDALVEAQELGQDFSAELVVEADFLVEAHNVAGFLSWVVGGVPDQDSEEVAWFFEAVADILLLEFGPMMVLCKCLECSLHQSSTDEVGRYWEVLPVRVR